MKNIKIKKTVYIVFVIVGLFIVQTFANKLGGFVADLFQYAVIDKDDTFMSISVHHIIQMIVALVLIFVKYENNQIMLEQLNDKWSTGPMEYPFGRGINLEMTVSNIDAIYKRVIDSKLDVFAKMESKVYKCGTEDVVQRQFLVQDPDGYLLRFCD